MAENPMGPGQDLMQVLQSSSQTSEMFSKANDETPGIEITTKHSAEGTRHTIEMDDSDLRTYLSSMKSYQQVLEGYQQEVDRLKSQQSHLNPILNVLATVGGATAMQDQRLPPVVRALGEASRKLNPTYQELEDRKLAVMQQQANTAGRQAELASQIEGRAASRQDRALRTQEMQLRTDILTSDEKRKAQADADKVKEEADKRAERRINTAMTNFDTGLKNTKGREVPKSDFVAGMKAYGVTDNDKIDEAYAKYHSSAASYRDAAKEKAEEDRFKRENSPAGMKAKEDEANADAVAKHIVDAVHAGDPTKIDSMRQVAGSFGAQKTRIMAKISKLDPNITEARLERIVKVEDEYSLPSGKANQQMVSYGQFGEHIGALHDAYSKLSALPAKYANKSINWLRKNAMDDPAVARVMVALEPVQNEFETFLKNNRALYESDRKSGKEILNLDMPKSQREAALNQAGETVKARYNQLDNSYSQVTGAHLHTTHPLPPEAIEGLAKVGIDMPRGSGDPVEDVLRKYADK